MEFPGDKKARREKGKVKEPTSSSYNSQQNWKYLYWQRRSRVICARKVSPRGKDIGRQLV